MSWQRAAAMEKAKTALAAELKVLYARDGLTLGLTRNGLEAYLRYIPPEVTEDAPSETDTPAVTNSLDVLSEDHIRSVLSEHQIVYGIQEAGIREFLADPERGDYVLIAQGDAAVPGEDARLEYIYEKMETGHSPKLLESGKVDLKDLNLNINVHKGDVLAQKFPVTPGKPGRKVTGEEIPPPKSRDCNLPQGKNTRISADGLQLISDIDGTISRTTKKLSVITVYTIKGDVDYSTGNIHFIGSVEIGGNVLSGFRVEAQDDITVGGIVEGAEIVAGGNVTIRRGVQGGEKADIRAGGSIQAKFVNGAKLSAKESILVAGAVMHSTLQAGDRIVLEGKNGVLNGGRAVALQGVEADSIGSEAGVATTVEVGINPELDEKHKSIQEELRQSQINATKVNQIVDALNKMKAAAGALPPEREKMLMDSIKTRYSLMARINQLEREFAEIEDDMKKRKMGSIKVRGTLFPGTTIRIRHTASKIEHPMKCVHLHLEGGEIVSD